MHRDTALNEILDKHPDAALVVSTGYLCRAVWKLQPERKQVFYMQGSMGLAPAIGLGMALNTDKEVVVLSGDGSLLMHYGIMFTIQDLAFFCPNLTVYVLENGCHESVGGQPCASVSEPPELNIVKVDRGEKYPRVGRSFEDCSRFVKNWLIEEDQYEE